MYFKVNNMVEFCMEVGIVKYLGEIVGNGDSNNRKRTVCEEQYVK